MKGTLLVLVQISIISIVGNAQTEAELNPTKALDYYTLFPFIETWDFDKKPYKSITISRPAGDRHEVQTFDSLGRLLEKVIGVREMRINRNVYEDGILVREEYETATSDGQDHRKEFDDGMATLFSNSKSVLKHVIDSNGKRKKSISYKEEGYKKRYIYQVTYDSIQRPVLKKMLMIGGPVVSCLYNNEGLLQTVMDSTEHQQKRTDYTYTASGKIATRLVKTTSNYRGKKNVRLEKNDSFFYKNGLLVLKKSTSDYHLETRTYTYNDDRNMTRYHYELTSFDLDSVVKWATVTYKYDGKKLLKKRKEAMVFGKVETPRVWEYSYDTNGNLSEIKGRFESEGSRVEISRFIYNTYSHIIKRQKHSEGSPYKSEWRYTIEYFN